MKNNFDAVVIGAGVFGAWIALHLRRSGRTVALVDTYGAGNSRSSSGGESRILRMGYGADEIYTRWAMRSRELWVKLFEQVGRPELFQNTGVLWTPPPGDPRAVSMQMAFKNSGVAFQRLTPSELEHSYPQFRFRQVRIGLYERFAKVSNTARTPRSPAIDRTPWSMRAGLGCLRFSPKFWAAAFESRARRFFSLERPPEIAASLRRTCPLGPTLPTSTPRTPFPIWKTGALSWRLTGTVLNSIPIQEIAWRADWRTRELF
jgi:glycine/D-amino acid oxidase-like deaminating enzyme